MLLEHLKQWREWNQTKGNPFYGKVDFDHIALMGHSRGGEAAATAAVFNRMKYDPEDANIHFDYNFPIQAVVAIAPPDGQYKPAGQDRWIENVSYLTLQGAHDADVSSFMGSRQWDHVRYSQPGSWFKAEIYAYRANHGQFNTAWGRTDAGQPLSWLLNLKPLMPGDEQRKISKTYIAAFLEATLKDRHEYLPLFEDWRVGRDWLPDTIYQNRYQQASYVSLLPSTRTRTSPPLRCRRPHRRRESVYLARGPHPVAQAEIVATTACFSGGIAPRKHPFPPIRSRCRKEPLPNGNSARDSTLEFSLAALDEDAPLPGKKKDDKKKDDSKKRKSGNRRISHRTGSRRRTVATAKVSRFAAVPPPLNEKFTKLDLFESVDYDKDTEPVFQTVRIPLTAFKATGSKPFDPASLRTIRLKFDHTPMSVICLSGLGFGQQ